MNYNRKFKALCRDFFYMRQGTELPTTTMIDNDGVFLYYKTSNGLGMHYDDSDNRVRPIYASPNIADRIEISKAERIMDYTQAGYMRAVILNGKIFYATRGMILDENKQPLLMSLTNTDNTQVTAGIDYSVLKDQDAPFNKFILKKLIPYLYSTEANFYFPMNLAFMNLSQFIVKANPVNVTPERLMQTLPDAINGYFNH